MMRSSLFRPCGYGAVNRTLLAIPSSATTAALPPLHASLHSVSSPPPFHTTGDPRAPKSRHLFVLDRRLVAALLRWQGGARHTPPALSYAATTKSSLQSKDPFSRSGGTLPSRSPQETRMRISSGDVRAC
ncbi:hypothetical protein P280DRAFT_245116 [Massarina eburnea CBS 473.64]|uniref:Uncharacterized protein n=1 Tax=Massarina eburnea CBS 473.64 TaxID=1395130 RepID=A0A6A6S8U1_9PLEO|nr:hypothetical protein P280DRAFT_245116 [Massarina eburnea CBS 473.64]